jgi:serine phosphatase RsbU (regulator of sigma subunit)
MSLRAQLVLSFLLLSVVPLSGVTIWSYLTSRAGVRKAIAAEAQQLADEMRDPVEAAIGELRARMQRLRGREHRPTDSEFERALSKALDSAEREELKLLLTALLAPQQAQEGVVPFARDSDGWLYAPTPAQAAIAAALGLGKGPPGVRPPFPIKPEDWVVALTRDDLGSGTAVGVARPVDEPLRAMRRTAAWNLAAGLALVGLAILGILPLSRRMTAKLEKLAAGALDLGRGNLDVRVAITSHDEFGHLAATFNRMAEELKTQQVQLLAQERLHYELEVSRRIQVELLPRGPLRAPFAEMQGISNPAREVGGDFFNYFLLPSGEAALVVGDVSGKGVPAALLMANAQATLRARLPLATSLASLAESLDAELDQSTPTTVYLTLFMAILDGENGVLRYVSAGHNAPFIVRANGEFTALPPTGRPLGLFPGGGYEEREARLEPGDGLFLFTDGLVETEDEDASPFGASRLEAVLRAVDRESGASILAAVDEAVRAHRGLAEPADDVTMVFLRYGGKEPM